MDSTTLESVHVNYKIRALAKVVHDADANDFRELRDEHGVVRDAALDALLQQLGRPLDPSQKLQFHAAYDEYALHLRGVDLSMIAKSKVTDALNLAVAIDSEAALAGLSLAHALDAVVYTHTFLVGIIAIELSNMHQQVFSIFTKTIDDTLMLILKAVKERAENRREAMPLDLHAQLVALNSALWFHVQHMEWFVSGAKQSLFFNAADHVADVGALAVWKKYIGMNIPACSAAAFEPALEAFPVWAHTPIKKALDYLGCGVISLYSLQRILTIWGPFSLLDVNFKKDLQGKFISLEETTETKQLTLATKGTPGMFVVTLSRLFGHLDLQYVSGNGKYRKLDLNRETGSWILKGISSEDFETLWDAWKTFPKMLAIPMGESYAVPDVGEAESSDLYSILHRACFRNNTRYVRRLLEGGSALIVNTAFADPSITSEFAWPPLLCAVNNPNSDPYEIVDMLVNKCGADIFFEDRATCTALYYAVVNQWPKTVRMLLEAQPTLGTSRFTTPLLLALGAHLYNASEADNRRVVTTVPMPAVVLELLRGVRDAELIAVSIAIVEGKLKQEIVVPPASWDFRGCEVVSLTEPQAKANLAVVAEHGNLCAKHLADVKEVLRLLRMHSFYLSCQALVRELEVNETKCSDSL